MNILDEDIINLRTIMINTNFDISHYNFDFVNYENRLKEISHLASLLDKNQIVYGEQIKIDGKIAKIDLEDYLNDFKQKVSYLKERNKLIKDKINVIKNKISQYDKTNLESAKASIIGAQIFIENNILIIDTLNNSYRLIKYIYDTIDEINKQINIVQNLIIENDKYKINNSN